MGEQKVNYSHPMSIIVLRTSNDQAAMARGQRTYDQTLESGVAYGFRASIDRIQAECKHVALVDHEGNRIALREITKVENHAKNNRRVDIHFNSTDLNAPEITETINHIHWAQNSVRYIHSTQTP